MRITIVKNDDFKTIGLFVETTNPGAFTPETVFAWGRGFHGDNFVKTISGDYYEKEVFALIKADIGLKHAENLMTMVSDALRSGYEGGKVPQGGIKLGNDSFYRETIERAEKELEFRIKNLEDAIINRNKK